MLASAATSTPRPMAPTAAPVRHKDQLMPDLLSVTKRPSTAKRGSSSGDDRASADGVAAKRKKRDQQAVVHPRLPVVPSPDDAPEVKVQHVAAKLQRLGLPVDLAAVRRAVTAPDADRAVDRLVGLLQAQRASALVQQQAAAGLAAKKAAAAPPIPPSPSSLRGGQATMPSPARASSPPAPAAAAAAIPATPTSLAASLPSAVVLTVDAAGRAVLGPAPSSPTLGAPRSHVVAAEIDGMGRVVLERGVLVDRFGASGAALAEARARGSIAPQLLSAQSYSPPSLDTPGSGAANVPLGFGRRPGPRLVLPGADDALLDDDALAAERRARITSWLHGPETDDDDDEQLAEYDMPRPSPPRRMLELQAEDDVIVAPELPPPPPPGLGKSTNRLARIAHRTFADDAAAAAAVTPHGKAPAHRPATPTSPAKAVTLKAMASSSPMTPVRSTPGAAPPAGAEDGLVDCLCHRADTVDGEDLVQCERCRSWFHLDCVDLDMDALPDRWACVRCTGGPMPNAWRSRQRSEVNGTPMRTAPILVDSAHTPRVGNFINRYTSSEVALAPSPDLLRHNPHHPIAPSVAAAAAAAHGAFGQRHVRLASSDYSPRSPSRTSVTSYGRRQRLQSGAFEDPLPTIDDDADPMPVPTWPGLAPPSQQGYGGLRYDLVEPPLALSSGVFPSTPSRYLSWSMDGPGLVGPPSTGSSSVSPGADSHRAIVDNTPRSRQTSAAGPMAPLAPLGVAGPSGQRFSFPSTPSSQELLAHFDTASTGHRYQHLPSFSPVCEQSPLVARHRRNRSSLSGSVPLPTPRASWAHGPPASSAGLIKAMMSGPQDAEGMHAMARSSSGLGIGFEAGGDLMGQLDF